MQHISTLNIAVICDWNRYYFTLVWQARHSKRPPEDPKNALIALELKILFATDQTTVDAKDNDEEYSTIRRWRRIVANDTENLPIGLLVLWISWIISTNLDKIMSILMICFTVARILHTICFAFQLQPWRTLIWIVGVLCVIAAPIIVLLKD